MIRRSLHLKSASSTQTIARKLAEKGAPAWTLVRADRQTRGRGRMDRRWSSGKGGLYFSLVLRPDMAPAALGDLSERTAQACARALEKASGLDIFIKRPNDILARRLGSQGFPRKVCGILLEASGDTKKVHWIVLGVGVNVNNRLPATLADAATLGGLAGRRLNLEALLRGLLREIKRRL